MELVAKFLAENNTEIINKMLTKMLLDMKFEKKDKNFLYFKENEYGNVAIVVSPIIFDDPLYTVSAVVKRNEKKQNSQEESTTTKSFSVSDDDIESLVEQTKEFLGRFIK